MKDPRTFTTALALACWSSLAAADAQAGGTAADTPTARGAYLVRSMACADCHTPHNPGPHGAEPDLALGLSGHPQGQVYQAPAASSGPWVWGGSGTNTAFWGPWGVSYAANLTPDATGLGAWTAGQFVQAMRSGKHVGAGRPIAPPMPWQSVGQLTEPDLRALFAYLKSQPPVRNAVPGHQPPVSPDGKPGSRD
jgi:cytochrome c553